MLDFGIFCYLLKLMGIYRGGGPFRVFEKFCSLFPFLYFPFFFLTILYIYIYIYIFFFTLGGPFSSVAPGHRPPMPPSRYATVFPSAAINNLPGTKPNINHAMF